MGGCRSCGAPFDFSIPAATPQAAVVAPSPLPAPQLVALPAAPVPKPAAVRVVVVASAPAQGAYRGGRALETLALSWRQVRGPGIAILAVFTLLCLAMMAGLARGQPLAFSVVSGALFFLVFGAIAVSVLRISANVLITDREVVVEQQKMFGRHESRIVFADVATFRCQLGEVRTGDGDGSTGTRAYDVWAVLNDGRVARVVAEVVNEHVAVYVTQLLVERRRALTA